MKTRRSEMFITRLSIDGPNRAVAVESLSAVGLLLNKNAYQQLQATIYIQVYTEHTSLASSWIYCSRTKRCWSNRTKLLGFVISIHFKMDFEEKYFFTCWCYDVHDVKNVQVFQPILIFSWQFNIEYEQLRNDGKKFVN